MNIERYFTNHLTKGEGMKTFINAARIFAVTLLFVAVSASAFGWNRNRCCPQQACPVTRCAPAGCKLQPEPVIIRKTCDHPGYYKQVCRLEYEPCEGKVEEIQAYPIYKGCYDETGNVISQ